MVSTAEQVGAAVHVPIHTTYPLGLVLNACTDIQDYACGGIGSWRDLVDATRLVRPLLGISPHAWDEACDVMSENVAAVIVAAILKRAEYIRTPGVYLRALVDRKRRGEFNLGPFLQALMLDEATLREALGKNF